MKTVFLSAALLFFAATASAQKEPPLPKDLPPFGPEKPLQAPTVKESKLDNGLTVWLVPQPGFPKVSFSIAVAGGYTTDPKDLPGLADLIAATIDQGTKSRNARQIAEALQAAGGDLSANAGKEGFYVTSSVLSSKSADGLSVLADVLENAAFPDNEVALAKRNLASSLEAQEANPQFLASRAMAKVLYGDSPYSVISATKESLAAMTPVNLRSEYARRFRPDRALVVVVGDFSADRMLATIKEKFDAWHSPAEAAASVSPPSNAGPEHAIFFISRPDSVQTTLALAAFGPKRTDSDYEAAVVANTIYGGSFGSRLTSNIREDKGYTYTPGSSFSASRVTGTIHTSADVRNAVTGPALNEIFYELNRLATTSPTDRELSQAKRFLIGIKAIQLQIHSAVASELSNLWVQHLPASEIGDYGRKISAVTAADVTSVGQKYFPAARVAVVAVGQENIVRGQLALFGLPIKAAP